MIAPKSLCPRCGLLVATTQASNWTEPRKHPCGEPNSKQLDIRPGDIFGNWVVLSENQTRVHRTVMYDVRCTCGSTGLVPGRALKRGVSSSCATCGKVRAGMVKREHHAVARTAREEFTHELSQLLALKSHLLDEGREWLDWYREEHESFVRKWAPAYSPKPLVRHSQEVNVLKA